MLATERLLEIEEQGGILIDRIVPIELDGQALRLVLYLKDGTNLRLTEQWHGSVLERYSYYWLTADNQLKIGWDNAPHHKQVAHQTNIQVSNETSFEQVMAYLFAETRGK